MFHPLQRKYISVTWPIMRKILAFPGIKHRYEYRHYLTASNTIHYIFQMSFSFMFLLFNVTISLRNTFFHDRDFLLSSFLFAFVLPFHKKYLLFLWFVCNWGLDPTNSYPRALAPGSAKTLLHKYYHYCALRYILPGTRIFFYVSKVKSKPLPCNRLLWKSISKKLLSQKLYKTSVKQELFIWLAILCYYKQKKLL